MRPNRSRNSVITKIPMNQTYRATRCFLKTQQNTTPNFVFIANVKINSGSRAYSDQGKNVFFHLFSYFRKFTRIEEYFRYLDTNACIITRFHLRLVHFSNGLLCEWKYWNVTRRGEPSGILSYFNRWLRHTLICTSVYNIFHYLGHGFTFFRGLWNDQWLRTHSWHLGLS